MLSIPILCKTFEWSQEREKCFCYNNMKKDLRKMEICDSSIDILFYPNFSQNTELDPLKVFFWGVLFISINILGANFIVNYFSI